MLSPEPQRVVGPFSGLLVVDLTHVLNGPFGTTILSDLGARVIKMSFASLNAEVAIALISMAMGMMNTALSQVGGEAVNLTFVTGDLARIARHLATATLRAKAAGAGEDSA